MKLIQRIGYYLGGFSIGLVILAFFLNGKKTSCSYGPEARVMKNINIKNIVYDISIEPSDSTLINHILKTGNINFSKSNTRQEPCGIYLLESNYNNQEVMMTVENCDSIATIKSLNK
ncbi:hypothetical protein [uncultured Algibacter sp.]|uniref:hypothetical protein n=1 Tax=uncultured Algibacter sp. TaxID=298659 RepID=UPI00263192C7|nr:hypothetical protein [uncultured Algibacter sp.]